MSFEGIRASSHADLNFDCLMYGDKPLLINEELPSASCGIGSLHRDHEQTTSIDPATMRKYIGITENSILYTESEFLWKMRRTWLSS